MRKPIKCMTCLCDSLRAWVDSFDNSFYITGPFDTDVVVGYHIHQDGWDNAGKVFKLFYHIEQYLWGPDSWSMIGDCVKREDLGVVASKIHAAELIQAHRFHVKKNDNLDPSTPIERLPSDLCFWLSEKDPVFEVSMGGGEIDVFYQHVDGHVEYIIFQNKVVVEENDQQARKYLAHKTEILGDARTKVEAAVIIHNHREKIKADEAKLFPRIYG